MLSWRPRKVKNRLLCYGTEWVFREENVGPKCRKRRLEVQSPGKSQSIKVRLGAALFLGRRVVRARGIGLNVFPLERPSRIGLAAAQ